MIQNFPRGMGLEVSILCPNLSELFDNIKENNFGNRVKHNGKEYTISGPEALSHYQVAEILSNATTKMINYVDIPEQEFKRRQKEIGLNDWWLNLMMEAFYSFRKGYHSQVTSTVEELTGRKATTFAQFAKDYADAFR